MITTSLYLPAETILDCKPAREFLAFSCLYKGTMKAGNAFRSRTALAKLGSDWIMRNRKSKRKRECRTVLVTET